MRVLELSAQVRQEDADAVSDSDNSTQGWLLLVFMVAFLSYVAYSLFAWSDLLLPKSASEHGVGTDALMTVSMVLIFTVFFITQPILFYFAWRYRGSKDRKAFFFSHSNKLETIWTVIPSVTLAGLILYGLSSWIDITSIDEDDNPLIIELYAKQFGWTARYAGADNELGEANVRFVQGVNLVGANPEDPYSSDDVLTSELHLPVGRKILFKFRSQDVIHSAYMPHFRAQMNCVPGMITQFAFTPTVTTTEMRSDAKVRGQVNDINQIRVNKGEDAWEFDYVLLCNKICGSAHYNMQMRIVVETEEEYNEWMKEQKTMAQLLK